MLIPNQNGQINLDKVKLASAAKPENPKKAASNLIPKFCLSILPYLNNETQLNAGAAKYGDQQLKFLYELLVLFKLIYVQQFEDSELNAENAVRDYEPKDYIRSILP